MNVMLKEYVYLKKDVTNVAKSSIEKHKGKRLLCGTKRGLKDNIKVNNTEMGCGVL